MKTLSIIVPVYNEERTIEKILDKVGRVKLKLDKEIIIVDDGSVDKSKDIIEKYIAGKKKGMRFQFFSKENGGKGSAVRKGIEMATGDIITIQDADLEYDPNDYGKLIEPILNRTEKVVYGSRFSGEFEPMYKLYYLGNKFLTLLTQVLYKTKITDMETCYKVFKSDVIKNIKIGSNGFDIEPEITSKILKKGIKIKEMPISYSPRSIEDGKKIGWRDGLKAIWILLYYRIHD